MRLVCPNCEAKYEVPDDAIPDTGRDVQCTNCGHTWYQMRGRTAAAPMPAAPPPAAPETAPETAPEPSPEPSPVSAVEPSHREASPAGDTEAVLAEPGVMAPAEGAAAVPDVVPDEAVETTPEATGVTSDVAAAAEATPATDALTDAEAGPDLGAVAEPADEAASISAAPIAAGDAAEGDPAVAAPPDDPASASPAEGDGDISDAEAADAADDSPAPAPAPAPAPDYAVDESVLSILREEAEREANARRAEALESQTDLGLDAALPRKAAALAAEAEAKPAARRDLLPDVEEINSTLRPSEAQEGGDATPDFAPAPPQAPRGFRSGFLTLMTIAILAAALYVVAPRLAVMVPSLAGPLESYVSMIDGLRLGLDGMMRSATVAISDG